MTPPLLPLLAGGLGRRCAAAGVALRGGGAEAAGLLAVLVSRDGAIVAPGGGFRPANSPEGALGAGANPGATGAAYAPVRGTRGAGAAAGLGGTVKFLWQEGH